jgi:hypothetical protein
MHAPTKDSETPLARRAPSLLVCRHVGLEQLCGIVLKRTCTSGLIMSWWQGVQSLWGQTRASHPLQDDPVAE